MINLEPTGLDRFIINKNKDRTDEKNYSGEIK